MNSTLGLSSSVVREKPILCMLGWSLRTLLCVQLMDLKAVNSRDRRLLIVLKHFKSMVLSTRSLKLHHVHFLLVQSHFLVPSFGIVSDVLAIEARFSSGVSRTRINALA